MPDNSSVSSQEVYIFAHISKTGGTSLRDHFTKHLKEHVEFIHHAKKGEIKAKNSGFSLLSEQTASQKKQVKVVLGHKVDKNTANFFPDRLVYNVVTFRDPESWLISRYNQRMHRRYLNNESLLSFSDWLNCGDPFYSQFNWLIARFYGMGSRHQELNDAEKKSFILSRLADFKYVLFLESLNHEIIKICKCLNIPEQIGYSNVSKIHKDDYFNKLNSTEDNSALINNMIGIDVEIYEEIKSQYNSEFNYHRN